MKNDNMDCLTPIKIPDGLGTKRDSYDELTKHAYLFALLADPISDKVKYKDKDNYFANIRKSTDCIIMFCNKYPDRKRWRVQDKKYVNAAIAWCKKAYVRLTCG